MYFYKIMLFHSKIQIDFFNFFTSKRSKKEGTCVRENTNLF